MLIQSITPERWDAVHDRLVHFFQKNGDKRITHSALGWLKQLNREELVAPGTYIAIALINRRLAGCIACSDYGLKHAIIAVNPLFRKQNVGGSLLQHCMNQNGKLYATVALDNIPSLTLCFSNGMTAFHLFKGPTGKPTLWLGGGNWSKEDVSEK